MTSILPEHAQLSQVLQQQQAGADAAEFHGQLCGLLAVDSQLSLTDWLATVLPGVVVASLPTNVQTVFQALLENSRNGLRDESFGFQLVLPDDDTDLAVRVEALGHWCQGFLLGVSSAGISDPKVLPGDLPEILDDFLGISQAESYELADEEEDEAAYTELMEYVRISAQLFCEELRVQSTSSPPTKPTGGQLH